MQYLVTGEQARQIDAYTIHQSEVPSLVLMERASLAVAEEAARMAQESGGKRCRILAICGAGNNGGDGMAAARILHARGWQAHILLVGNREKLSEDAARQLRIAGKFGVPLLESCQMAEYDIIIDALFGTGLCRQITGRYADVIEEMNAAAERGSRICAVDIASGIDAATGKLLGTAVKAEVTVTFGYLKVGMILYPGAAFSGRLVCAEIGFDPNAVSQAGLCYQVPEEADLKRVPARRPDSHKGTYGKVLTIAGSRNMAGAAAFSGKAAYLTGSGLVTLFTPECNREILQGLLPEAVMKTYAEEGHLSEELEELIDGSQVIVIGPGLGKSSRAKEILQITLENAVCPLVIDADALNILAEGNLRWLAGTKASCILTPHKKELSRLTGYNTQSLEEKQIEICEAFSRRYGVILIAKDARTLVHDGTGNIYVNTSGNNGMSTGGSGDVLTGMIAGLIAQGADPCEAARLGVYLHGLAGDQAASDTGVYSMTASDILQAIPAVMSRI